jgi:hypothetical protein
MPVSQVLLPSPVGARCSRVAFCPGVEFSDRLNKHGSVV